MTQNKSALYSTIALQSILIFFVFRRFFLAPAEQMFCNIYDGFKNYLTIHSYVHQEKISLTYEQMNYPFGDFITFTDNTPLFSILLKMLSKIFPEILNYDIAIFNFICLGSILISSILLFKIFDFIKTPTFLSVFFATLLPWISPQLERLNNGHFNLSFSWIILLGIWLLIRFYYSRSHHFSLLKSSLGLIVLTIGSTYVHIYHTSILAVMIGGFGAIWWITQFVQLKSKVFRHPSSLLLVVVIFSLILSLASLSLLDEKLDIRQTHAEGYGFEDWKLRWTSLISSFYDFPLRSILHYHIPHVPYESYLYLGFTGIVGMVLILFSVHRWFMVFEQAHTPFILILFITALLALSISLGEKVFIGETEWTNRLNPFYYLHKITDRVEQFRCISRFAWIFFWVANISVVYYLGLIWKKTKFSKVLIVLILLISSVEGFSYVKRNYDITSLNNLSQKSLEEKTSPLLKNIDVNKYQAILPVPYFHVGCENYDFTIDPEEDFFIFISQLSIASGLPNMGSKMSRTPVIEAQALMSIFTPEIGYKDYLMQSLKKQPILVVYDKSFYANNAKNLPGREPAKKVVLQGEKFIKDLSLLSSDGQYEVYEWNPL